jgi:drug/metabolite transporter (DMT)-like permease
MPIWSMVLAYFFLGEKISIRKIIGIVMGGIGLFFLIGWSAIQSPQQMVGGMVILLAAFAWASANIVVKKKFVSHDKLQVSAWQMVFGTIGIVLFAIIMEWDMPIAFTSVSIFTILFCGIIASAFCFTAWFYVLSKLDTTVASICLLLVPVFGLFFGWLQLGEEINISTLLGILSIIIGVYFTTYNRSFKKGRN